MATEEISPRFADLDLWPTREAVDAMLEGQLAAAAAVRSQAAAIAAAAEAAAERLRHSAGRLIYVGAGTSGRLALLDGVELGPTYGWPAERTAYLLAGGTDALVASVEGAEDDAETGEAAIRSLKPKSRDVIIAVAASGRTPYTVGVVISARAAGALTVGLANNPATPLLEAVEHPILLDTGSEIVAGSTRMKAGTAQKIALNAFSTAVMLRLGGVYRGRMVGMRLANSKLRRRAVAMVRDLAGVSPTAAEAALQQAGDDIKLAVLIAVGIAPDEAARWLQAGDLRAALAKVERRAV